MTLFRRTLSALILGTLSFSASAQENKDTFVLGTVEVTSSALSDYSGETVLRRADIDRHDSLTLGEALTTVTGVHRSRNNRNEEAIYLRGFDSRQVPVFVDGIPLYVPYDGYIDFGRFTTFDLAEIRVARGGASLLYGPNTLGGAINMVTRKPQAAFEGDIRLGWASGAQRSTALNVGAKRDIGYIQLGASLLKANSFPLPSHFRDYKNSPTDVTDYRQNAAHEDKRFSFKLGLTPNAHDEYALGYVRQDGKKENPVYTGTSESGIRYWRWPDWDKDSVYFIGSTQLAGC